MFGWEHKVWEIKLSFRFNIIATSHPSQPTQYHCMVTVSETVYDGNWHVSLLMLLVILILLVYIFNVLIIIFNIIRNYNHLFLVTITINIHFPARARSCIHSLRPHLSLFILQLEHPHSISHQQHLLLCTQILSQSVEWCGRAVISFNGTTWLIIRFYFYIGVEYIENGKNDDGAWNGVRMGINSSGLFHIDYFTELS